MRFVLIAWVILHPLAYHGGYGAIIDSHNDHRVAMAIAMASLKTKGDIKILNAGCVSKSFPNFFSVFESLGGIVSYED